MAILLGELPASLLIFELWNEFAFFENYNFFRFAEAIYGPKGKRSALWLVI